VLPPLAALPPRTVERVAADANTRGLSQPGARGLVHGLISKRARPRHDADLALHVNVPRHDADLALSGLDDACVRA
jgi:hypothetical protein